MARVTIAVVVGLLLMLLTSCGDLGSDPSTIAARNRIRDAQAERIIADAAMTQKETDQRLALQRETHEIDLAVRTIALPTLLAVAIGIVVGSVGVRLYRYRVAEQVKLLDARARAKEAEAKALEAEMQLLTELRAGTVDVARRHDGRGPMSAPRVLVEVPKKDRARMYGP